MEHFDLLVALNGFAVGTKRKTSFSRSLPEKSHPRYQPRALCFSGVSKATLDVWHATGEQMRLLQVTPLSADALRGNCNSIYENEICRSVPLISNRGACAVDKSPIHQVASLGGENSDPISAVFAITEHGTGVVARKVDTGQKAAYSGVYSHTVFIEEMIGEHVESVAINRSCQRTAFIVEKRRCSRNNLHDIGFISQWYGSGLGCSNSLVNVGPLSSLLKGANALMTVPHSSSPSFPGKLSPRWCNEAAHHPMQLWIASRGVDENAIGAVWRIDARTSLTTGAGKAHRPMFSLASPHFSKDLERRHSSVPQTFNIEALCQSGLNGGSSCLWVATENRIFGVDERQPCRPLVSWPQPRSSSRMQVLQPSFVDMILPDKLSGESWGDSCLSISQKSISFRRSSSRIMLWYGASGASLSLYTFPRLAPAVPLQSIAAQAVSGVENKKARSPVEGTYKSMNTQHACGRESSLAHQSSCIPSSSARFQHTDSDEQLPYFLSGFMAKSQQVGSHEPFGDESNPFVASISRTDPLVPLAGAAVAVVRRRSINYDNDNDKLEDMCYSIVQMNSRGDISISTLPCTSKCKSLNRYSKMIHTKGQNINLHSQPRKRLRVAVTPRLLSKASASETVRVSMKECRNN